MVTLAVFKVCLWVLSLLPASVCFASDPWITCTDDNRLITVNTGDQIRIRSQNWPDSMVVRSQNQGGRTTTRCRIQLEHKLKLQFIVITILSGNLGFGVGSQVIVDTNSDSVDNIPNVRASCPFRNKVCLFEIDQGTNNYTANTNLWSGFEAIVTAYENEKECPFDTGDKIVTIENDEPIYIASTWDFESNFFSKYALARTCQWKYKPAVKSVLKIAILRFVIVEDEEFTILENGKEVLKANATHPPSNFVFYTKTDFTITYNRVRRQPADGNIVAVISSYPAEPVSYQAPTCSESSGITTVTKDSPVSLTNNPMSSVLTAYENYQNCKWQLNTKENYELHFWAYFYDIDSYGDVLEMTIGKTASTFNKHSLFVTRGTELATLSWKSDGNYGRAGFIVEPKLVECVCSTPLSITLNDSFPVAHFSPQPDKTMNSYCANMRCEWKISSPAGTLLNLEINGFIRMSKSENDTITLVNNYDSETVQVLANGNGKIDQQSFHLFTNKITVTFRGCDSHAKTLNEDEGLSIAASYWTLNSLHRLPDLVLTKANGSVFLELDLMPENSTQMVSFDNPDWSAIHAFAATYSNQVTTESTSSLFVLDDDVKLFKSIYPFLPCLEM